MTRVKPLHAVTRSLQSNWRFWRGRVNWTKKNKLETVVALGNAQRIIALRAAGEHLEDIEGLEKGMEILGFNSKVDAENHLEREYSAPVGLEREDW